MSRVSAGVHTRMSRAPSGAGPYAPSSVMPGRGGLEVANDHLAALRRGIDPRDQRRRHGVILAGGEPDRLRGPGRHDRE